MKRGLCGYCYESILYESRIGTWVNERNLRKRCKQSPTDGHVSFKGSSRSAVENRLSCRYCACSIYPDQGRYYALPGQRTGTSMLICDNSPTAYHQPGPTKENTMARNQSSPLIAVTLTIPRADLITQLTTRRTEIQTAYDTKIEAAQDIVDNKDKPQQRWINYYQRVLGLLLSNDVQFDAQGYLKKGELPRKPNEVQVEYVKQGIGITKRNRDAALQVIDDTLNLLNMSIDENVTVQGEHYQHVLSPASIDTAELDHYLR